MKCPDCGSLRHEGECKEYDPRSMDREATQFAMELLMPADILRAEVKKIKDFDLCETDQIKKLAVKFGVPLSVMAIRLGQLSAQQAAE